MNATEQKNMELVADFIQDTRNESLLNETNQFFSPQITQAFIDRKYEVDEIFVDNEKAIARIVITAVHAGHFAGNEPTGKTVRLTQYREFEVVNGEVVKHKGWFDTGTLLLQLQG